MDQRDRNLIVYLGSARPAPPPGDGRQPVVVEDAERGLRFEVVEGPDEGKPGVERVTISSIDGGLINDRMRGRVPVRKLARVVQDFRRGLLRNDPNGPLGINTPRHTDTPEPELVAKHWHKGWGREELADHYRVQKTTADAWLGKARRRGLIPPAKTGRPARKDVSREGES